MDRNKILITGASGTLGYSLVKAFAKADTLTPTHSEFDITDYRQCNNYIANKDVSIIIHSAAMTDLDQCEKDPDKAVVINTVGTNNMVRLARAIDAKLVFVSTHAVFGQDSSKQKLTETTSVLCPKNVYGKTKFAAEQLVQTLQSDKYLILRLGWLIAEDISSDKKFTGNIYRLLNSGTKSLRIVNDTLGNLCYAPLVAQNIKEATDNNINGIRHIGSLEPVSRSNLMRELLQKSNLEVEISEVPASMFKTNVNQPLHSALSSNYNDLTQTSWKEQIKLIIKDNQKVISRLQ